MHILYERQGTISVALILSTNQGLVRPLKLQNKLLSILVVGNLCKWVPSTHIVAKYALCAESYTLVSQWIAPEQNNG